MSQPNVVPRVNAMVQSMERPYIDLTAAASQQTSGTDESHNSKQQFRRSFFWIPYPWNGFDNWLPLEWFFQYILVL